MTEDEIQQIARSSAAQAVEQTLERLGFDVEHPIEVQQDVAYMHKQRIASDAVGKVVRRTLIGLVITGSVALFVVGLQQHLGK